MPATPSVAEDGEFDPTGWGRKQAQGPRSRQHPVYSDSEEEEEGGVRLSAGGRAKQRVSGSRTSNHMMMPSGGGDSTPPRTSLNGLDRTPGAATPEDFVETHWIDLYASAHTVSAHMLSTYTWQVRGSLLVLLLAGCSHRPDEPPSEEMLSATLSAVQDELNCIRTNLGGHASGSAVLAAEYAGALWRAALSALQLLVLNQAGFRPLTEEESEILRKFLTSLQEMFAEEVPTLTESPEPTLDPEQLPEPAYPRWLQAEMVKEEEGLEDEEEDDEHTPWAPWRFYPPPPDPAAARNASTAYISALLQAAEHDTSILQGLYTGQAAGLQESAAAAAAGNKQRGGSKSAAASRAQSASGAAADGSPFVPLGAQQLPLLDLLRLLRQRRKTDPAAGTWAAERLRLAAAVLTQEVFGLVSSERPMAEARCALAAGSRTPGRMIITQRVLCFTTLLDGDAKGMTDTSLTVLIDKLDLVAPGMEPNSLQLTTCDYEDLAFVGFASAAERDRVLNLLHAALAAPSSANGAMDAGGTTTPNGTGALPSATGPSPTSALSGAAKAAVPFAAGASDGSAMGATAPAAATRHLRHHSRVPSIQRRGGVPADAAAAVPDLVMSVPCALHGTLRNREGVLSLYKDRLEFVTPDGTTLHRVALDQVQGVTQQNTYLGGTLLAVQVEAADATARSSQLLFANISDALLASLKQTICDLA